ncbi:hypothetical protein PG994_014234 [Apiospora phragmitis]|uniref:Uncharacterized protein n=1 Tax=Apiospora phragmitis TaxID=2905665 RepID=A0ABR1T462_9PEZI
MRDAAPVTAHPTSNAAVPRKKLIATALLIASVTEATGIAQWTATGGKRTVTANGTAVGSLAETTGGIETGIETETEMLGQKGAGADLGAAAATATEAETNVIEIGEIATTKTHAVVAGTGARSPAGDPAGEESRPGA